MTAHEVFVSLFWLIVVAYGLYLGWFAHSALRSARRTRANDARRVEIHARMQGDSEPN